MSKQKDTDYLFISTRLRSLENRLLTRERMERMLEARTNEDAAKVLSECGYEGLEPLNADALEQALAKNRRDTFAELSSMSPNPGIVDVFRMKYDYHNAKALVKCMATGQDPQRLMIAAGRIAPDKLREMVQRSELGDLPDHLRRGITEAQEKLAATGDPQRCDLTLDLYYFEELKSVAAASGSSFLQGYVRLMIDAANLKSAVRLLRMKKGPELSGSVLMEGGNISKTSVAAAVNTGSALAPVFTGALQEAASLGDTIVKGGRQTAFEKACDDALNAYLQSSRMTPFGDSVLVAFAAAKENEITAARIILSGRLSGVPTASIRERLRDAYV